MRIARNLTIAAGGCALIVGIVLPRPSEPARPASTAQQTQAELLRDGDVVITPGQTHEGHGFASPPTTAACEKASHLACYTATQIIRAYDLAPLYRHRITGRGTTIVIVDSYGSPTIKHDLNVYDKAFGLPAPPSFRVIAPAGKIPAYNPHNGNMVGWAGETTLDVEMSHTIAPGANILLVETPVNETEGVTGFPQIVRAEEYVIGHHLGDVISQSFSATEQTFASRRVIDSLRVAYTDAYRHAVTVLAASGDSGAADVELNGSTYYLHPVTSWPDSDPLVTGVGGTQLHLNAKGDPTEPATVWNDSYNKAANEEDYGDAGPNPLAGGGGKSIYFGRPSYQNGVRNVVGGSRGVPDISMSGACNGAVDNYQSFGGQPAGWYPSCGTSESTPAFAGIVALADQVAGHPIGLVNPELYELSLAHAPGIVPVVSGNNTVAFYQDRTWHTVHGFSARPVYSLAAGVGTVNAAYFVPELAYLATHQGHR